MKLQPRSTSVLTVMLSALVLTFVPATALAGGPGGGGGTSPIPSGDDVTSLPRTAAPAPTPGFVFTVETPQLAGLLARVSSPGGPSSLRIVPQPDGLVSVVLSGNFTVSLETSSLRRGDVQVRYLGKRRNAKALRDGKQLVLIQR